MTFSMDSVQLRRMLSLLTEWDCGIVKLKGVGGKEGQLLSCSDEHCFCLSTI